MPGIEKWNCCYDCLFKFRKNKKGQRERCGGVECNNCTAGYREEGSMYECGRGDPNFVPKPKRGRGYRVYYR